MKIKLSGNKKFIIKEEKALETDELDIVRIVYIPDKNILRVFSRQGIVFEEELIGKLADDLIKEIEKIAK